MSTVSKFKKETIVNSTLWKPPFTSIDIPRPTNSWFDISQLNYDQDPKPIFINTDTIRSRPIIIYPTPKQRTILLQWNEVYRQVYNITVKYLKTNKVDSMPKIRPKIDEIIFRNKNLSSFSNASGIPKHTRDNAINDCLKAYKTCFANLRAKNIKFFNIRPKKLTHHLNSIVLEPSAFSKTKNAFAIKQLGEMKSSELFNVTKESRLCYNARTGIFVLRVPYDKNTFEVINKSHTASLDPGIRTFQTVYSPEGNCYEICSEKSNAQIYQLLKRIDRKKPNNETNPRTIADATHRKYTLKLREKLRNKITDMHYKTCNFLCRSFDKIIIGNMSTKSILSKTNNLSKYTKKCCLAQSHYLFKQRLTHKAEEYGTKFEIVDESYTSKTCGSCGEIKPDLAGNKVFKCSYCSYVADRDISAARNILIKHLG